MEPLHPEMRKALKRAHPGLTDEDIDRYEQLLVQRMQFDPDTDAKEIQRLDHERMSLLEECMPRYREVAQSFAAKDTRSKSRPAAKVKIKPARTR